MPTVDTKGRIVLPKELRERLGITPGTEVEIIEEGGRVVVEPEDEPEQLLSRMDTLVERSAANREETSPLTDSQDPVAKKHREAVQRGARENSDE